MHGDPVTDHHLGREVIVHLGAVQYWTRQPQQRTVQDQPPTSNGSSAAFAGLHGSPGDAAAVQDADRGSSALRPSSRVHGYTPNTWNPWFGGGFLGEVGIQIRPVVSGHRRDDREQFGGERAGDLRSAPIPPPSQ